jgi:hypothetical protein
MYTNLDPSAELAYRRERISAAFRAGSTRGSVLRHRRFRHLPRRTNEQRA